MADLGSLLEGTTPHDLPPLDLDDLAGRARRRERRKRAAVGAACLLVVVAVTAVAVSAISRPGRSADVQAKWAGPGGEPLEEPVGSWAQADDPPFPPRRDAFGAAFSDGRVLIWGGHDDRGRAVDGGGIYDPSTGDWTAIPPGPLVPPASGEAPMVQLTGNRLAVLSRVYSNSPEAAIYDVEQGRWLEAPALELPDESGPGPVQVVDARAGGRRMAWNGEVLALLPGYNEPATWRWRIGDDAWQRGTPPPTGARSWAGTAFDGRRLAVWGGSSRDGEVLADGAIYDVATDTWDPVPPAAISGGEQPTVMWFNDRLLVSLSTTGAPLPRDQFEDVGPLAIYDPISRSWEVVPPPPGFGATGGDQYRASGGSGSAEFVVRTQAEDGQWWFWQGGEWEQAPLPDLRRLGGFTVALTAADLYITTGPGLALQVREPGGEWLAAAAAPFDARFGATIVATGDKLVVVGGAVDEDELAEDAWVFDLAG